MEIDQQRDEPREAGAVELGNFCFAPFQTCPSAIKAEPEDDLIDKEESKKEGFEFVIADDDNREDSAFSSAMSGKSTDKVKCNVCKKVLSCRYAFFRHFKALHENGEPKDLHNQRTERKCQLCGIYVKQSMVSHMEKSHPSSILRCKVCPKFFLSAVELQEHSDKHLTDLHCTYCDFRTSEQKWLRFHLKGNHEVKNIQCPECPVMVSSGIMLSRHRYRTHVKDICQHCNTSVLKRKMTWHKRAEKCLTCKQEYFCLQSFREHKKKFGCKSRRGGMKTYSCKTCGKIFSQYDNLRQHIRHRHAEKPVDGWLGDQYKALGLTCSPCKRYFSSQYNLEQHNQFTHNLPGMNSRTKSKKTFCDFCGRMKMSKKLMETHILKNHYKKLVNVNLNSNRKKTAQQEKRSVEVEFEMVDDRSIKEEIEDFE